LPPELLSVGMVDSPAGEAPAAADVARRCRDRGRGAEGAAGGAKRPRARAKRAAKRRPGGAQRPARRARRSVAEAGHRPRRTDDGMSGARAHRPVSRRAHTDEGVVTAAARRRPLPRSFYERDSETVARALLGTILECDTPDGRRREDRGDEAYLGPSDPASHAAAGLTARTFISSGSRRGRTSTSSTACIGASTPWRGGVVRARRCSSGAEPVDGILLMRERRWGMPDGVRGVGGWARPARGSAGTGI